MTCRHLAVPVLVAMAAAGTAAAQDRSGAPSVTAPERQPAVPAVSPLQSRVDAAAPGDVLVIAPGRYEGDLVIDKPLTLIGRGGPLLAGSGQGSVVRVRAAGVVIDGLRIDGGGGGDLGRDPSGIHVAATGAVIRDCEVRNALFGIYLHAADAARVERCTIRGVPGKDPGESGSGIHVWNTQQFTLEGNDIAGVRDGFYIQSSSGGRIAGNRAEDLRYGLHYMFSDDNVFEDNTFESGAAGAALMYSRRITFRRNRFIHNRGFASVGLLLKECDDVVAEANLIADNARGVFIEGSYRNLFRRNVIALSDTAIVLYQSSGDNRFEGNLFTGNMTPLTLVGPRTDTRFVGNFWSGNRDLDLDGDGYTDRPYRLSSAFDHLRGNLTAADLYADGFAAAALAAAETAFPVLEPVEVFDSRPLAAPPVLPDVPRPDARHAADVSALAGSALLALIGMGVLVVPMRSHRRRRDFRSTGGAS